MTKERFFYTTHYPHRWTSGPSIFRSDGLNHGEIKSLDRARELAEHNRVDSFGEDRCVTTYGVEYIDDQG